jgi:hypothetical protein
MKKHFPHIIIPHIVALTAIAGLLAIATTTTQAQTTDPLLADSVDQSEFPQITAQPVDQTVPIGANVVLSVQANNADGYQWLQNGVPIDGQTNNSLTIYNAGINDAGFYSCEVSLGTEIVPTRAANVMVYEAGSSVVAANVNAIAGGSSVVTASMSDGEPIVVFGLPISGGGTQNPCPGNYAGYINYTKTISQGWGWTPAGTVHTAADGGGRTDTKIMYGGEYGDTGCNKTTVTIPNPPPSPVYRFTIYFPNHVPTTNYPIVLTGFNP